MRTKLYFASLFILAIVAGLFSLVDFQEKSEQVVYVYEIEQKHEHHKKKRKRRKKCNPHYSQDYQRIKINTHADVVLREASHPSEVAVHIEGCGVRKSIHGGVLHLNSERKDCHENETTVYITHGDLQAVDHNGSGELRIKSALKANDFIITSNSSGDIFVEDIQADELKTYIKGSADIMIQGEVDQLRVLSYGSGNFRGYTLDCDQVKVECKGSGDVMVTANEHIDARIYGSGDVKVKGDASVPTHSKNQFRGSGRLHKMK